MQQSFDTGSEALCGPGPEVLDVHVGLADEAPEELAVRALLHIERDAALVAVVGLKVWRVLAALVGAVRVPLGALDLDDVRAEVRQHHSGAGPGDERALLDDANARQCRFHGCAGASTVLARLEVGRGFTVVVDRLRRGV